MNRPARLDEQGVALLLVLLTMTLVMGAAMTLSLTGSVATLAAANHEEALALGNAAETALHLAARELGTVALSGVLAGSVTSALVDGAPGVRSLGPGVVVDLPVLTNRLSCGRATSCTAAQVRQVTGERPWGHNNPRWRPFVHRPLQAPPLPLTPLPIYVAVWIGDDAREDDGDPAADGAGATGEGRYIVRARAEAFGPRGGRRAIEAELRRICTGPVGTETCLPGSRVQSWRSVSAVP